MLNDKMNKNPDPILLYTGADSPIYKLNRTGFRLIWIFIAKMEHDNCVFLTEELEKECCDELNIKTKTLYKTIRKMCDEGAIKEHGGYPGHDDWIQVSPKVAATPEFAKSLGMID